MLHIYQSLHGIQDIHIIILLYIDSNQGKDSGSDCKAHTTFIHIIHSQYINNITKHHTLNMGNSGSKKKAAAAASSPAPVAKGAATASAGDKVSLLKLVLHLFTFTFLFYVVIFC